VQRGCTQHATTSGKGSKGEGSRPCAVWRVCAVCADKSQSLHVDSRHVTVTRVVDEWRVTSSMWPVIECVDGGRSLYEYRQGSTWAICQNRINERMGGMTNWINEHTGGMTKSDK